MIRYRSERLCMYTTTSLPLKLLVMAENQNKKTKQNKSNIIHSSHRMLSYRNKIRCFVCACDTMNGSTIKIKMQTMNTIKTYKRQCVYTLYLIGALKVHTAIIYWQFDFVYVYIAGTHGIDIRHSNRWALHTSIHILNQTIFYT